MNDTLSKYIEEAEQDSILDVFNVKDVQSKLPGIKHKWVGRLIRTKQQVYILQEKKEQLGKKLLAAAKEKANYKISDAVLYKTIEGSEVIKTINGDIKQLQLTVLFLEKTEKVFSQMTFDIKNLADIMKLETM